MSGIVAWHGRWCRATRTPATLPAMYVRLAADHAPTRRMPRPMPAPRANLATLSRSTGTRGSPSGMAPSCPPTSGDPARAADAAGPAFPAILEMIPYGKDNWRRNAGYRPAGSGSRRAGSRSAGSMFAAPARPMAWRSTSTPPTRRATASRPSSGLPTSRGAMASSGCGASATAGSRRSRSPPCGHRTCARSSR